MHGAKHEDLDNAVYHWFILVREESCWCISQFERKAEKFAAAFGIEDFHCSNGWIDRFKQWHDLKFRAISGKTGEVSREMTSNWLKDVFPKLTEGYQPEDIYSADEVGLFCQLLPSKTLASKENDCAGTKKRKQRVTLLLGANMNGTGLLCPPLVGKLLTTVHLPSLEGVA